MAYIHEGTNKEHSEDRVKMQDRCTFNYCPDCNDWFYRLERPVSLRGDTQKSQPSR